MQIFYSDERHTEQPYVIEPASFPEDFNQHKSPLGYRTTIKTSEGYDFSCLEPTDQSLYIQALFKAIEKELITSMTGAVSAMKKWVPQLNLDQNGVYKILNNPVYCGLLEVPYRWAVSGSVRYINGGHEALVTKEQFATVNDKKWVKYS